MSVVKAQMPNDAIVYYRDADHSYWKSYDAIKNTCSGRVSGVSTISKCSGETNVDGLLHWAVRLANEGKDWKEEQQAKGDVGQGAHDFLEELARGNEVEPQTLQQRAVQAWWNERNAYTLDQERIVYSPEHSYAGRFDLLALIDGKPILYDLKTSTYVKPEHIIQLNLYEIARREVGYGPADELAVLHYDAKQQKINEIPVPIRPEWALTALASYGNGKEIRAHISKAQKVRVGADSK